MSKKERKRCQADGCKNPAQAKGYCLWPAHQALRTDADWLRKLAVKAAKPKKVYTIPKVSKKYAKELAKYNRRTPGWKKENPFCIVPGCGLPVVDRHHVIGRGKHLNDEKEQLPLCAEHHKLCKEKPLEAERLGLIKTRTIVRKNELPH